VEYILEIDNLIKSWPGFTLDLKSLNLPKGYILGFIGPNGAGKTTTIKLIMNLINKDSGQIKVFGQDHIRFQKQIRDRIGFVYDEGYFYEHLDPVLIKQIIAPFYSLWDEKAFKYYINKFQIPLKPKFKDLSRGEKTKFSLALALSHNAEFIIMDEPTAGLDPVFRHELLDILANLMQDETKSILFSTHITSDLQRIADYICFIHQGKIVFYQDIDTVLNNYIVVKGPNELLNEETRRLFSGIREHSYGFEAMSRDIPEVRRLMDERVVIDRASLDDIMLYTVREDKNV